MWSASTGFRRSGLQLASFHLPIEMSRDTLPCIVELVLELDLHESDQ